MITIAIISPQISLEVINKAIENQDFSCIFFRYIYKKLEDIPGIYDLCKNKCDAILFSGEFGYHYAVNHIKNLTVPCSFISYTEAHVLTILLNTVLEYPNIPLNRVYMDFVDFLGPSNGFFKLQSILPIDKMPYCFRGTDYSYDKLLEQPLQLYQQHKIDIVLTRATNNVSKFQDLGIPYINVLPTENMIVDSIRTVIDNHRLKIGAISYKVVIILKLLIPADAQNYDREYIEISFHKRLVDFRREQGYDFVIVGSMDRFELYVETGIKRERLRLPQSLIVYLEQGEKFSYRLGVGIGETLEKSRNLAENALFAAIKFKQNDGFAMEGDDESLIGPLSAPTPSGYSYSSSKAIEFSCKNGISESNLFRIVDLFEMNPQIKITSASLAAWLKITTQSSNRILAKLFDARLIEDIPQQEHSHRGRPFHQYCFVIKNCEHTFW